MLVDMIGLDTFHDGMNAYLMDRAYSTEVLHNLWTHLAAKTWASGFFAGRLMLSFQ